VCVEKKNLTVQHLTHKAFLTAKKAISRMFNLLKLFSIYIHSGTKNV
jgi:hypothetical protein